jgi:tetratricopeptide (TPR) repeat protein
MASGAAMKRYGFGILFSLALVFFSCRTVQDDLFMPGDELLDTDIGEIEKTIVAFDAAPEGARFGAVRRRIEELDAKPVQDRAFKAQLAAWSGRLYLLEGSRGEAARQLALSREFLPSNIQAAILAARLERDAGKRLDLIEEALKAEPSSGELGIERARVFLEQNKYREAAAAFDTAFAKLPPVYGETYRADRNRAWDMRDIAPGENAAAAIAQLSVLSWREVIELTKKETELLDFLTAGKDWPNEDLFSRLAARSFIPPSQDAGLAELPPGTPAMGDTVLRSGAAWFLWRLVAENRSDKTLLTRYSDRYRNRQGLPDPVADIPVSSAFFDSVVGCVQWEIMTLPDGKSFFPQQTVRGAAFLNMLGKAGSAR